MTFFQGDKRVFKVIEENKRVNPYIFYFSSILYSWRHNVKDVKFKGIHCLLSFFKFYNKKVYLVLTNNTLSLVILGVAY